VRQVVEEGGSLSDAADSLDEDAEDQSEIESLPLEPGRTDVVRVMNVHKAKGLESNVVFLADPTGGAALRIDSHIERHGTKALGWFKIERKSETSYATWLLGQHEDWPVHELAEEPYRQAEEDRLLYVAATRAREMLIVSRWPSGNPKYAAWGILNAFLASATELPVPASAAAPVVEPLNCSPDAQEEATQMRLAAHDRVRQPSWSISSVTADAHPVTRITRSAEAASDDPTKVVGSDTPAHRADAGMAWGSLIHGLLEHAMRHHAATRDDLRRLAMWLTVEELQLRTSIDDAIDTVQRVAGAEFWQAAKAGEHSEETPFMVSHDPGVMTNGVIDLLFKGEHGWSVRDYKTDVSLDATNYDGQLGAYRKALEKMNCKVADTALVHVRDQDVG
jgi:ATP-dependent helicase/nuclease subunit A